MGVLHECIYNYLTADQNDQTITTIAYMFWWKSSLQTLYWSRKSKSKVNFTLAILLICLLALLLLFPPAQARGKELQTVNDIVLVCTATQYPEVCISSLNAEPSAFKQTRSTDLIKISILVASKGVSESLRLANRLMKLSYTTAARECFDILEYSIDWLHFSNQSDLNTSMKDIQCYLSAILTYQDDCYSSLQKIQASRFVFRMMAQIQSAALLISNSLSMLNALETFGPDPINWKPPLHGHKHNKPPFELSASNAQWMMKKSDRKLLEDPVYNVQPSVTVSTDGLADFSSIQAAVSNAPAKGLQRYIIYIKAGIYNETVRVPSSKTMVMFIGDGINRTIITGNRNVGNQPNMTTFESATVAVSGAQFLARDLTIENTAGAASHQAVALRVDSDKSAFYRCSILGFQDTLYSHVLRQFFKECVIEGTIDFIFGNAASVFQNCTILVRVGREDVSTSTITAQGRIDPAQATGFVLQNCTVNGTEAYMQAWQAAPGSFQAFLGRPWKSYSKTIFMETYMEALIQPQGWMPWNGTFALTTLFYGEFLSSGPGSNSSSRVAWSTQLNFTDAQAYTIQNFIQGNTWLPSSSFPYSN